MDRNHLETSKKGRDQKGMALFPQWAEVIAQLCEFPPERSEAWTLNWDSRHRAPVPGSGPTSHPAVKSARFLSARERQSLLEANPLFFPLRGQSTGLSFIATHLGLE